MILSSPLLSSYTPPKSFRFHPTHHFPISKDRILMLVSESKSFLGGKVGSARVSDQKKMTELVGIDDFRGESSSEREAEAVMGDDEYSLFERITKLSGFETTLNRMSKWLVAVSFGLVILWKHDAEVMWMAMGSVVNAWISITLKQILNHERPASAQRSDPGMPSSHAQSIFYAAFIAVLSVFDWLGASPVAMIVGSTILLCGTYLAWLRVSQKLHTVSQVVVGAILGSACGISWFWMWHSFVLKAFIASIWVRLIVVLGSVSFCLTFILYVIQHWLKDDE